MIRVKGDPIEWGETAKPLTRKQREPLERFLGCEIRDTVTKVEGVTKGRPRIYVTAAERQRAYRERKRQAVVDA